MKHEVVEMGHAEAAHEPVAEAPALLPLDSKRTVAFSTKRGAFVYEFRRIGQPDWLRFFQSIVHQTVNIGPAREEVFETESALLDLVDRTLVSVEGYGDTSKFKHWKRSLPMQHRIAAGIGLRSVGTSESVDEKIRLAEAQLKAMPNDAEISERLDQLVRERDGAPLLSDLVEVSLDANWGTPNGMTLFSGLIHRFRQPSIEDLKKFNFESARTRVTGTAEAGITTYPARQAIAMSIYDDLIESVDGYAVGGRPLEGVENIRREMDGAHKAVAALELFAARESIAIA